jgi:hypothetical protein
MSSRIIRAGLLASLFALVLGSRWMVINRFGTDMPQWDQWDAEGINLLAPWFQHHFTFGLLFKPHNEHRVALTKLVNLGVTLANGQWDQRLEAVVNAIFPGLIAIGLFSLGARNLARPWQALIFLVVAAGYSLPLAWQNVLGGFHSQQYFLIGLSLAAIVQLSSAKAGSGRWLIGAACAGLALGSMATGFFAAVVVAGVVLLRILRKELPLGAALPTLALSAVVATIGWATHVVVDYHEPLKAKDSSDFILTAIHSLQWPVDVTPWAAVVLWLPWLCLVAAVVLGPVRTSGRSFGWIIAGLGGWTVLQIAATAYARGAGGPWPSSRYVDTLIFGAVVNAMALGWLFESSRPAGSSRSFIGAFAAVWSLVLASGVWTQTKEVLSVELPWARSGTAACEETLRNYLATGDERYLQAAVPYPDATDFLPHIRIPELRAILPASVRPGLAMAAASGPAPFIPYTFRPKPRADGTWKRDDGGSSTGLPPTISPLPNSPTWGSFGRAGSANLGDWSSKPLSAPLGGWLRFETAGDIGEPGHSLELRDASTLALVGTVRPSKVPKDSWREAYVRAPARPFIVVAHDGSPNGWMAFSQPVEMASLSHLALRAAKQGWLVAAVGAAGSGVFLLTETIRLFSALAAATLLSPSRRRRTFNGPTLAAAAVVAVASVIPFLPPSDAAATGQYSLEVRLSSPASGNVQVYYNTGSGYRESDSSRMPIVPGPAEGTYRLPLPFGTFSQLRFDPIDSDGTVTIASARIIDGNGNEVRAIGLNQFAPLNEIQSLNEVDGRLVAVPQPGSDDPQLSVAFDPPLALKKGWAPEVGEWLWPAGAVFGLLGLALLAVDCSPGFGRTLVASAKDLARRPLLAVVLTSAVAVAASAYPVILLGRSYVSPNYGASLLYDGFPTLPGYADSSLSDIKGSDVGAIAWQQIPYSVIQHRSLWRDGELPLWNRYNSSGLPLLGQGQSMFGDPLHFLVLAARGSAWAWDLKFLIAKWLFALGLGLLVLAATRHLPSALIVSLAGPFVGFFVYRVNHPAFFSLCYSPWPLYCWMRASQAVERRKIAAWYGGLILANFALLNSGTVKEAFMLLLTMNLSGVLVLLAAREPWSNKLAKLAGAIWAGTLFVLISAPFWGAFLVTLKGAYTAYDAVSAFQIQPGMLLGAFDEAFYRPLSRGGLVFNPSANFLILAGLLYFLATLRSHFEDRTAVALGAASLLPLSFAFGLVPPAWIVRVPFLANVAHIDNSFSCGLIVLWAVLAGIGFASAARRLGGAEGRADLTIAGLLLFGLVFGFVAFGQAVHRSVFGPGVTFSPLNSSQTIQISPFLWGYLGSLLAALATIGWLARRSLRQRSVSPAAALVIGLCCAALLWRQGLQAGNGIPDYVVHPAVRVDFRAPSAAVSFVRHATGAGPARSVGIRNNLFPGWTGVYGIEGISGPDALMNRRYRELSQVSPLGLDWGWRLYVTDASSTPARRFLDFLNVRYYFGTKADEALVGSGLRLDNSTDLDVFESPTAWPRAFFTDRLSRYEQPQDLVRQIVNGDGRPFAAAALSDFKLNPILASLPEGLANRTVVPAEHYRLTENSTSFDIAAPSPGLVILGEALWPGYSHAELDGHPVPVLPINHAFQGVAISAPGLHTITVRYRPRRFLLMEELCAAGLVLLGASGWLLGRNPD